MQINILRIILGLALGTMMMKKAKKECNDLERQLFDK